jgi:glycosyltransferase involved in cell wall biosynthesis
MRIAALLPHVEVFGGVRRYLELGNEFAARGHDFVLFTPEGRPPDWLPFAGRVRPFTDLARESFDVSLCGEYDILDAFDGLAARVRYFYFVLEGHRRERGVARRPYQFLGNSEGLCRRMERRYGIDCRRAPGGINPAIFHPLPPEEPGPRATGEFRVLCYGRLTRRRKGVPVVIRAVERLRRRHPGLKLVFFDTPVGRDRTDPRTLLRTSVPHEFHLGLPQTEMARLFGSADAYVGAEKRAGWANTAAEAMACGLPVVCTPSGTRDFARDGETALVAPFSCAPLVGRRLRRLIEDPALRARLAEAGRRKILEFTWARLADRLLDIFEEDGALA